MHYFIRDDDQSIASCEDARHIPAIEAQGFTPCTHAAFSAAWAERDRERRLELAREEDARPALVAPVPVHPAAQGPAVARVWPSSYKH